MQRRKFISRVGSVGLAYSLIGWTGCGAEKATEEGDQHSEDQNDDKPAPAKDLWFDVSLAQWSLHRMIQSGELDNLDFAKFTKDRFGIDAVEYVNKFFPDKAEDRHYIQEMKQRADDVGVQSLLVMVDDEGMIGHTDAAERQQAVENHYKWVDAAHFLGCHSIRVNAAGQGSPEEVAAAATDGLRRLSEYSQQAGLNILVENHGGYSSNGAWLASVIRGTEMDNCGTLPDFGNFCITHKKGDWNQGCDDLYDRYRGITELMPFAKAVSAKSNDFDDNGQETSTDFERMLRIVKEAGYRGHIGIEYEGSRLSEVAGIEATHRLMLEAAMST